MLNRHFHPAVFLSHHFQHFRVDWTTPRYAQDLQLVWQATVSRAPVALTVAKLGAIPGIVCSLDDEGVLSACYQGTDPPTSAVVAADTKEVDYDQINQEHRKLLQVDILVRGAAGESAS